MFAHTHGTGRWLWKWTPKYVFVVVGMKVLMKWFFLGKWSWGMEKRIESVTKDVAAQKWKHFPSFRTLVTLCPFFSRFCLFLIPLFLSHCAPSMDYWFFPSIPSEAKSSATSNPFCRFFASFSSPYSLIRQSRSFCFSPLRRKSRVLVIGNSSGGWVKSGRPHMCVYSSHAILKTHFAATAAAALCTDVIRMNLWRKSE